MKKVRFILSILLMVTHYSIYSQQASGARGTIIDSENGEAVFGATVFVRALNANAKTDFDGKYQINLPPGEHDIEFQMMGYAPQKRKINVANGRFVTQNITFGSQVLDAVEVQGRAMNNTSSALLQLQRKSGTVSDGISQESIKKSPDTSAGEAMKRVTGITLIGGKYVFVRGLGERYSNTTLNDSYLPSTEPDKKVVPLDIFPSGVIKNIRVMKSFSPEDPAEFSGGLVKIETVEYPDQFTMTAGLGIGYNNISTGQKFLSIPGGDFFGRTTSNDKLPGIAASLPDALPLVPGNRFSGIPPVVVGAAQSEFPQTWTPTEGKASYDKNFNFTVGDSITNRWGGKFGYVYGMTHNRNYRYRNERMGRYLPVNPVDTQLKDLTSLTPVQGQNAQVYNEDTLWGNNLNLAYEFTKGHQMFLKNLYTVNSDKTVRDSFGYNLIDNFEFQALTNTFTSRGLRNHTLGGEHAFIFSNPNRPHKLDWNLNLAQATREEPNLQQQIWRRPQGSSENLFRLANNPDGSRFYSNADDNVKSLNVKYEIPFEQWDGLKSSFKIGSYSMDREKTFRFREFGSKNNIGTRPVDYYPIPGEIVFNAGDFIPNSSGNSSKTFSERQVESNAYDAMQKLQAYFGQVDLPLMNKVRFLGGLRFENSYQKVRTFVLKDGYKTPDYGCRTQSEQERLLLVNSNVCDKNNNGVGELSTKDYLPSMNFVWEFHPEMNLRFGYNQTLTRPDLRELSPFGFTPFFGADRIFGNPDLKRTYIHNYDVRWEWYVTNSDYIGVGVFNKYMSNPIEMIGQPVAGSISPRFTYVNGRAATINGIEFDYRKELNESWRFETNVFLIKSRVDVLDWKTFALGRAGFLDPNDRAFTFDPTNLSRQLQGQSPYVVNLKLEHFLDKKRNKSLSYYYNYFGDRIYAVGANGTPDAYEKGIGIVDLVYSHQFEERFDFKFAIRNAMNTRFKIYQKNAVTGQEEIFMSYREGVVFTVSGVYKL
jgi:outer membrane receptor protein involved in Fe transport